MKCHSYHTVRLLLIVSSFVMSACSSNDEAGASNVGNTDAGTSDVRDEGKAGSSGSAGAAGKGGFGGGGAGQAGTAGAAGFGGGSDEAGVGDSGRGGGAGSPCDVSKIDCSKPACAEHASDCPEGEVCDGEDNDGDSRIDEGNACGPVGPDCPPGAIQLCDCFGGVHRQCKADGTWGPCVFDAGMPNPDNYEPCETPADCKAPYDSCYALAQRCVSLKACVTADVWTQAACNSPEICDYGRCVDYTGVKPGTECLHHADCSGGEICDMGRCLPDPFPQLPCFE